MDTFTLDVGYRWRTSADLLVMPVPNQTETAWHAMTALIDTRACPYPWFLTIRIVEPTFRIPGRDPAVPRDPGESACPGTTAEQADSARH